MRDFGSLRALRTLRFSMNDHNTQDTLLLDLSITRFRQHRGPLREKRRDR